MSNDGYLRELKRKKSLSQKTIQSFFIKIYINLCFPWYRPDSCGNLHYIYTHILSLILNIIITAQ